MSKLLVPSMRAALCAGVLVIVVGLAGCAAPVGCEAGGKCATPAPRITGITVETAPPVMVDSAGLSDKLERLCWVAYAPTHWSPEPPLITPTVSTLRDDLRLLRQAGFSGLVTYGSDGILGQALPRLAQEEGFTGLIMGLWQVPLNDEELRHAQAAAALTITVGYVVGNEGLYTRYELPALRQAVDQLRAATGKPVATTEQVDKYAAPALLQVGDWVFPNVHPYFNRHTQPDQAALWTENAYAEMKARTKDRPVIFKEVGLPSSGDPNVSEQAQADYYRRLQLTAVQFVYFEAFDELWKQSLPVEPHWGIFHADRSPKPAASIVCGKPH